MEGFEECDLLEEFFRIYDKRKLFGIARRRRLEEYRGDLRSNIKELQGRIQDGAYAPDYRGTLIRRETASSEIKFRGITPLEAPDLIVQRLLLKQIVPAVEQTLCTPASYGRRKGLGEESRSPLECCREIARLRNGRDAFRSDFVNFFPSIERGRLLEILDSEIGREVPWWPLLQVSVCSDSRPDQNAAPELREKFWPAGKGVHQGTVLASLLANLYLSAWDVFWSRRVDLFRYVDDWLILVDDATEISELIPEMLKTLPDYIECHFLSSNKHSYFTRTEAIEFVGFRVETNQSIRPGSHCFDSFKSVCRQRAESTPDFVHLHSTLSKFRSGWCEFYKKAGLSDRVVAETKRVVESELRRCLSERYRMTDARSQNHVLKVFSQHPIKSAKDNIFHAWDQVVLGDANPFEVTELLSESIS